MYMLRANCQVMATREEIGALIRARRGELGLTQQNVADACRVSKNSFIEWEKGNSIPRGRNLISLARALKLSPEQLTPDEPGEAVVERDQMYPSFQQFLDEGLGEGLTEDELARVRGDGNYGGDPGLSYWVLRAQAERARRNHMKAAPRTAANLADAARQPGAIPLKKRDQ